MRRLPLAAATLPDADGRARPRWTAERLRFAQARERARVARAQSGTVFEHDARGDEPAPGAKRPETRGDCLAGGSNEARPCPWASCKYHLALDVNQDTGVIKLNFPDREPWELAQSCALDMADGGGMTLEQVSDQLLVTRERIRQIEAKGLRRLQARKSVHERLAVFADAEWGAYDGLGLAAGGRDEQPPAQGENGDEEQSVDDGASGRGLYSPGRVPLMGHGDLDAEAAWLLEQDRKHERERNAARDGSLQMLHGVPLSPRAAEAIAFIRECWAIRGTGPSSLEIADALEVNGTTEESRRAGVSALLAAAREGGLVVFSRATGAKIVDPKPKETPHGEDEGRHGSVRERRADVLSEDGQRRSPKAGGPGIDQPQRDHVDRGGGVSSRDAGPLHAARASAPRRPRQAPARCPGALNAPGRIFLAPAEGPASVIETPAPAEEPPVLPSTLPRGFDFEVPAPPDWHPITCSKMPTPAKPNPEENKTMLTEKQQQILDRYEAGEPALAIATALGTTQPAVDSCIYQLRKRGLVMRERSARGGARPASKGNKPTVAAKVRGAKRRSAAPPEAKRAKPAKPVTRKHVADRTAAEEDILASARDRINAIEDEIGPLVAEKARLVGVVEMLGG